MRGQFHLSADRQASARPAGRSGSICDRSCITAALWGVDAVLADALVSDLDCIAVDDRGTADNVGTGGCCSCKDYGSGKNSQIAKPIAHGSFRLLLIESPAILNDLRIVSGTAMACFFGRYAGWRRIASAIRFKRSSRVLTNGPVRFVAQSVV
jgi:hypothetical protein